MQFPQTSREGREPEPPGNPSSRTRKLAQPLENITWYYPAFDFSALALFSLSEG